MLSDEEAARLLGGEYVKDPWQVAEISSKSYSEGDTNDSSGWDGCYEASDYTEQAPKIECTGARTILFHGGEEITGEFVCNYEFEFQSSVLGYRVVTSSCN